MKIDINSFCIILYEAGVTGDEVSGGGGIYHLKEMTTWYRKHEDKYKGLADIFYIKKNKLKKKFTIEEAERILKLSEL
jgi:hypothetical protein